MITAALAFIHERKWLIELILAGVVIGLVAWWHHATYVAGMDEVRRQDRAALDQAEVKANLETARLKGIADAAEKQRAIEHDELVSYRASDPLHGGLCAQPRNSVASVPKTSRSDSHHGDSSSGAATVQPVPAGDPAASGQSGPDVRHLLDVLAGRADEVSATLREFQAPLVNGLNATH